MDKLEILAENIFTDLINAIGKSFKSSAPVIKSKVPAMVKAVGDISHEMSPQLKSLVASSEPVIFLMTKELQNKFYNMLGSSNTILDLRLPKIPYEGLSREGITNANSLKQNVRELNKLLNATVDSKVNLQDIIKKVYTIKKETTILSNEVKTLKPNSSTLSQLDEIVRESNKLTTNSEQMFSKVGSAIKPSAPKPVQSTPVVKTPVSPTTKTPVVKTPTVKPEPKVVTKPVQKVPSKTNTPKTEAPSNVSFKMQDLRNKSDLSSVINSLLSKSLYEGNELRNNMFTKEIMDKLTPNTKAYFGKLYDQMNKEGVLYTTAFKDDYGRLPQTLDDKVLTVSGNHWGGYGRNNAPQENLQYVPVPTQDVLNNILDVTMHPSQKQEFLDMMKKLKSK
jgi:hypothetical protein